MDRAPAPGRMLQVHGGALRLPDGGLDDSPSGLVVPDDSGLRRGIVPALPSDEALGAALSAASFPPAGSGLLAPSDDRPFLWLFLFNLVVQAHLCSYIPLVLPDPLTDCIHTL